MSRTSFQKVLVIVSLNCVAIQCGFIYGHMAGMVRSLQKKDEGISLSENQISLIAAFTPFCFVIGFILLAVMGDKFGRRWCFIFFSIPLVINWIILYCAREFTTFMLSRFFAGVAAGTLSVLNLIAAAEYTSPKYRALFLSMISMVASALGTGLSHMLGVLFHWRNLALVGMFYSIFQLCLPYLWVESPHWLASQGRFEDCEKAFRKLHGNIAENELQQLIKMETNKLKASKEMKKYQSFKKLLLAFKKRYFWDLLVMNNVVYVYYTAAGKVVFSVLATVMLEEITGTPDVLLFTLLVDSFILTGACISCVLIKKMSIRNLLFTSGLTAIGILISLSICLFVKNSEVYFQWIKIILLALYFIIIHVGPYPVMEILLGEMFPLELKLYSFLLATPILTATVVSSIMLLPILVSVMGYHGLFLLNSAIMLSCLGYLWTRLPETKGKTLQEIEVYFKTNNFDVEKVLNSEQIKALI